MLTLIFVKRLGIVLKIGKGQSVILLDQDVGKIFIKPFVGMPGLFAGAVISYILQSNNQGFYLQDDSVDVLSRVNGYCYDKLSWLHELLEIAGKYIAINDSCKKSFQIIYKAIMLISRKLPAHHIAVMHIGSLASLITTLGYVRNIFLQEFIELFDQYCKLSSGDELILQDLDFRIKSLEVNITRTRKIISTFRKEV